MALPFTGLAGIITAMQSEHELVAINKVGSAGTVGYWVTPWNNAGSPLAGGTDSSGTQYVNGSGGSGAHANVGGFVVPDQINVAPAGRILVAVEMAASTASSILIYDRLCAIGPLAVTSTGSISLSSLPSLPRYTSGFGVEAWLQVTTAFGATVMQAYLNSYTGTGNGSGTSALTTDTIVAPASAKVDTMIGPFPLLVGDNGISAISSFDISVASSAGAVNFVLLRRFAVLVPDLVSGEANSRNTVSQIPCTPIIYDGATLSIMYMAGSTSAGNLVGQATFAYQ